MKTSLKIIISQIASLFTAYFIAGWLGDRAGGSLFDVGASGFIAFFYWPLVYILLITLISNLAFLKINKWNYLTPLFFLVLLFVYIDYSSKDLWPVLAYLFGFFICGWVLAKLVNLVIRFAKK